MLRHLLAGAVALVCLSAPTYAQTHADKSGTIIQGVAPIYLYNSAGAGQMALAVGTATKLTPPANATIAEICVETASVRYRDDGTNATTTSGVLVAPSSSTVPTCFTYGGPLSAINFTAVSGSPTLDVLYYVSN